MKDKNTYVGNIYSVVPSYAPIFNGFYENSLFDPCEKDGIEIDDESLDFNAYYKKVSTSIVNIIQEKLSEFLNVSAEDVMIVYDGLQSPKYYNYRNDVIACTYYVSPLFVDSVLSYLHDNTEALQKYLTKHFESRSGFISDFTFVFSNVNVRFFLLEEIPDDSLEEKTLLYLEKFFEDVEEADDYIVVNREDCNCIFMNGYLAHSYADTAYVDGAGRVSFKGFNGVNNFHSADFKLSDLE